MYKTRLIILVLLLFSISAWSFNPKNLNEHFRRLENMDKTGFKAYLDSINTGKWIAPDSIVRYQNWLIENEDYFLQSENIFFKSVYFIENSLSGESLNNQEASYRYIDEALLWLPNQIFPELHFKILRLGSNIAMRNGDYETEKGYLKKMIDSGFLSYNDRQLSDIYLDIASCNWSMHHYDESMTYCNKVQPILKIQDYKEGKIRALLLMYHNAHFSTIDTTWADYLDRALVIAKELGDSSLLSNVYYTIGYSHYRESEHLKAIEYYNLARSFEHVKGSESELGIAVMQQLSYTLSDSVDAVNRISAYIIGKAFKNNIFRVLGNAYRGRAWYFAKTGQKDSAAFYLDKAHEHRQSLSEKSKASPGFYYYLYEVALMIKDYERALKFLNISSEQVRQISRETNAGQLSQSRAELDYDLQRERIEKLTLENKLEKERSKRQRILISGILLILLLGGSFLAYALKKYKELRSSYREVFRKNIELDKLNIRLLQAEEKLQATGNGNSNGNGIKDEEKIYKRLKELFEKEKIYKQPDISSRKLARILKTNTSYLSAIVNSRFDDSLKTVINRYRINEARRLLTTPEFLHFSIEGIAEEVGYKSRSTFYQSFKQITGLTPTQYLDNYQQNNAAR